MYRVYSFLLFPLPFLSVLFIFLFFLYCFPVHIVLLYISFSCSYYSCYYTIIYFMPGKELDSLKYIRGPGRKISCPPPHRGEIAGSKPLPWDPFSRSQSLSSCQNREMAAAILDQPAMKFLLRWPARPSFSLRCTLLLHAQAALHWLICQKKLYLKWAPRNLQISRRSKFYILFFIFLLNKTEIEHFFLLIGG